METRAEIKELFDKVYIENKSEIDKNGILIEKRFKNKQIIYKNSSKNTVVDDIFIISNMDGIKDMLSEINIVTEKNLRKILSFKIK